MPIKKCYLLPAATETSSICLPQIMTTSFRNLLPNGCLTLSFDSWSCFIIAFIKNHFINIFYVFVVVFFLFYYSLSLPVGHLSQSSYFLTFTRITYFQVLNCACRYEFAVISHKMKLSSYLLNFGTLHFAQYQMLIVFTISWFHLLPQCSMQ